MEFHLFHNDKKTWKDELILALLIFVWLLCGSLLIVYRPSFFFAGTSVSVCFGVLLVLLGVMFIPGLVYRLLTNEKRK